MTVSMYQTPTETSTEDPKQVRRLRILLSAYLLEPNAGSEEAVGWHTVEQLSKHHDVWIITRGVRRDVIEKHLAEHPLPNVTWIYHEWPVWLRFWKDWIKRIYYYMWQFTVYPIAAKLHKEVQFDIAHHLTLGSYWSPSLLSLLPTNFVWGPVGGGEDTAPAFYKTYSLRGRIFESLRNLMRSAAYIDPFVRLTVHRTKKIFTTTKETEAKVKRLGGKNIELLTQVALPQSEIDELGTVTPYTGDEFHMLSIGRMLHWKGFHLAIEAFARFEKDYPNSEYWLLGKGAELKNLKVLAESLNVGDKVHFFGHVPRAEVFEKLSNTNVLVHPALHEAGGWICSEAMAAGKPIICLDCGGPAVQVTENEGFLIPPTTPEETIDAIYKAMKKIKENPEIAIEMGESGRKRVLNFRWEEKSRVFLNAYEEILGELIQK